MSAVGVSLVSHCAANIVPKPIEWLWPERVAIGKQTLIAGKAGLGKSQIGIAMAAAVTTGGPWPCNEGDAPLGNVIILSAEDDPADTILAGTDAPQKFAWVGVPDVTSTVRTSVCRILHCVSRHSHRHCRTCRALGSTDIAHVRLYRRSNSAGH